MNKIVPLNGSSLVHPIACRLRCAPMRRRRHRNPMPNHYAKRDQASLHRHPNGHSSSTPKRPSMRHSGCASAHISSAKATN